MIWPPRSMTLSVSATAPKATVAKTIEKTVWRLGVGAEADAEEEDEHEGPPQVPLAQGFSGVSAVAPKGPQHALRIGHHAVDVALERSPHGLVEGGPVEIAARPGTPSRMSLAAKSRSTSSLKLPLLIVAHDPTTPAAPEGVLARREVPSGTRANRRIQVGSNARRPDRPDHPEFPGVRTISPGNFWVVNRVVA